MKVKSESEVAPTLHDPKDCSPPGSSIHGILQARVLEWGAVAFSDLVMAPCQKRQQVHILKTAGGFLWVVRTCRLQEKSGDWHG